MSIETSKKTINATVKEKALPSKNTALQHSGIISETISIPNQKIIKKFLKRNALSYFKHALEFGCGDGENALFLSTIAEKYSGADLSHSRASATGKNIVIESGRLLPYENASFDIIFSFWTLQYLESDELVLHLVREFNRILEPHSYVLLCERSSRILEERLPAHYITMFCSQAFNLLDVRKLQNSQWNPIKSGWRHSVAKFTDEGDNIYIFQKC